MPKFLQHCFIKKKQAQGYEADKDLASQPPSSTAVLQIDFAENYTGVSQDEVQSANWNQAEVSLFTTVMWFRGSIYLHVIASDYM